MAYCQECRGYLRIRLYRKELEICGNDLRNQGLECGLLSNQTCAFVSAAPFLFSVRSKEGITVSHPEKILYQAAKFTKADVVDYYGRVASYLLPHFRNRPVTLKRFPDGVHGEAFYEKDAPAFTPKWVKTFPVPRGPDIKYILINDSRTLLWAANVAALELHPFLHCVPHIERPTHVVFDLDPGRRNERP